MYTYIKISSPKCLQCSVHQDVLALVAQLYFALCLNCPWWFCKPTMWRQMLNVWSIVGLVSFAGILQPALALQLKVLFWATVYSNDIVGLLILILLIVVKGKTFFVSTMKKDWIIELKGMKYLMILICLLKKEEFMWLLEVRASALLYIHHNPNHNLY